MYWSAEFYADVSHCIYVWHMKPGGCLSVWCLHLRHATGCGSKIRCHRTAIKEAFMLLCCEYLESSGSYCRWSCHSKWVTSSMCMVIWMMMVSTWVNWMESGGWSLPTSWQKHLPIIAMEVEGPGRVDHLHKTVVGEVEDRVLVPEVLLLLQEMECVWILETEGKVSLFLCYDTYVIVYSCYNSLLGNKSILTDFSA